MHFRPTKAVIDLNALAHNYSRVKKSIHGKCPILAMVKADAYGHGAVEVAKKLSKLGVRAFGVATVEEGIELRDGGLKETILILGGFMGMVEKAAQSMIEYRLTPVIHSPSVVKSLDQLARKFKVKEKLKVHLKIDTGMSRLGVTPQGLPKVLELLENAKNLKLEGIMTHLAFRLNPQYTKYQVEIFQQVGEQISRQLKNIPVCHIANSASVLKKHPLAFDWAKECWVRPGIMLYGIAPYKEYERDADLKAVMSLKSRIVLVKNVSKGTKVSYNCTFVAKRKTRLGVTPIGYADGYPWTLSGKAQVLIGGKRCPIVGRVTMDMTMVDLTDSPQTHVGSEVVLMGSQGREEIRADELADWAKTIPYEIVCRISKRMPRVYLS